MADIKEIVAKNIIELRKKQGLTQTQLAEKINYSDNAVSRWERAEVTPTLETLQDIARVFNVEIETLLRDDAKQVTKVCDRKEKINKLAMTLILVSIVWLLAVIIFVCGKIIYTQTWWTSFIWAIPVTCLVMYPFNAYWGRYIYKFVILSIFTWAMLTSFYLQFINYNVWLIFVIGIPIQVGLSIWAFVMPKNIKK